MPSLNDKENKRINYEIDILLAEMGFFSDLSKMKIRFNPRPFSKTQQLAVVREDKHDENIVDLHLEIIKEIDELLEKHDKQLQMREPEPITRIQQESALQEFVEIRDSPIRKPIMPQFQTEIETQRIFGEIYQNEEFFEGDIPDKNHFQEKNGHPYDRDINSRMLGGYDRKSQKSFMGLGNIKIKRAAKQKTIERKKEQKKINGYTKTKIELERTKKEIEARERALAEAIQKEKEKEGELKRKAEEKKKEGKLRQIELKKRTKQKKIREKEEERLRKQKEKEMKKLEREKLAEEKIKQREREKLEKEREKELKKLEQEKLKEQEIRKREKEKAKNQRERKLKKHKEEKTKKKKIRVEKEEMPPEMTKFIKEEKETTEASLLDDDVEKLLPILDELLEKLPDEVVDEFAQSDEFVLYEKVMTKYKHK